MTLLADLLSSLFDRRQRTFLPRSVDNRPMEELVSALIGAAGEVSGSTIAGHILDRYALADEDSKRAFFRLLAEDMAVSAEDLRTALEAYEKGQSKASYLALVHAAEPKRQELIRRLNQVEGATRQLVDMRADLLRFSREDDALQALDVDFRHLFASWFNRGFLVLRPISWESPANILEKIIQYEAVHAIDSWDDLQRRLEPADRRCFAFFHPAMPDEPLIFVEVALTKGIPASVQDLLADDRAPLEERDADTAVFYSISNCQDGLAGISFGNSLIKQVAADLSVELPGLKTFVTLSPIPGFRAWLDSTGKSAPEDPKQLKALAANYLMAAKRGDGQPLDPVARFHLGNGAQVHQVHANADLSDKGQRQSAGVMVNYLYNLAKVSQNHDRYATSYDIAASSDIKSLSAAAEKEKTGARPMANPLYDALFGKHAGKTTPFLHLPDGSTWTHADFLSLGARFAHVLTRRGLKPGDRLAAQIQKSPQALALYAACAQAGVIFLPLNTAYTVDELTYFIENSGAALVVCDAASEAELAPVAQKLGAQIETLNADGTGSLPEAAKDMADTFETVDRSASDLAAFLYTSGTTGRSKGAMLTQDNLLSNAEMLTQYWRFTADDVLLHALPIFHTHGLFVATNVMLSAGGPMIFLPKFDTDAMIANLPKATSMMGVPTFYTRLLDDDRFTGDLTRHMRLFISGSAPLLAETHVRFEERTGHRILERYGMTETNMNTSNPYEGERRAGTVGFPLPGVELKITNPETGETLADGEVGQIEVRGPNVFKGYWQMPEKTAAELRADGFFITGDLGKIDADGYVHIVGRNKDLIISGGYNIYPKEIELVLDEQPGVLESAVIGVPHADFGETVVGLIVAEASSTPDLDAIQTAVSGALARFKHPRKLILVDSLPRNTMGKVQKNILRETYGDLFTPVAE